MTNDAHILWFEELTRENLALVGGKNASIGELVQGLRSAGVRTPPGFATTAGVYWTFVKSNGLDRLMAGAFQKLVSTPASLAETGAAIRSAFLRGAWPDDIAQSIIDAYRDLGRRTHREEPEVAVRSSATAEDLPTASFAGQLESFLNIRGEQALLEACRRCLASLFTDRAISYRIAQGFDHLKIALSVGVQMMVRSDLASAGVMFSVDTETGFDDVIVIDGAWGLGESVVQGTVDPDSFQVFKPLLKDQRFSPIVQKKCGAKEHKVVYGRSGEAPTQISPTTLSERAAFVLTEPEILTLARWGCAIEAHYGQPMDMEWAKDGETGEIFIVQARPETVQSQKSADEFKTYRVSAKGKTLAAGMSVGEAAAIGPVCRIDDPKDIGRFVDGAVLVTRTTDPDWVPIMKRAAAIVTERGGRTSHAAIVSRELGLPAIVGAKGAADLLRDGLEVTVSCAEGAEGFVYEGAARIEIIDVDLGSLPQTHTKIMLNLANPEAAFRWWRLPADGVGLARMEFVIGNHVKAHPMALLRHDQLKDHEAKSAIAELIKGSENGADYFVDRLARGLACISALGWPNPVIIRTSDFKSNEYAHLIGGAEFEPQEENPMIGFRGASRYYSGRYREGFDLECQALRRLRQHYGFTNVIVMIPFCRTLNEADRVLEAMAENGLIRGENGLRVYVMCEIPSNVILAKEFARRFDGFSIGSNDLTQLTLGVDRDSADLAELFDENDEAVKRMIRMVIEGAHAVGASVGLCGQAPSDDPKFAEFLVKCGIDSISVTPDSFFSVKQHVFAAESAAATSPGRAARP